MGRQVLNYKLKMSTHASEVDKYQPPTAVANHIIAHAIRNIPGKESLLQKIQPRQYNPKMGLTPHEYNDTGKLQFVYQN